MPVPNRSMAQRMDALHVANEVRSLRANLKRDIKSGRENIVEVLISPPEWTENMKIFDLLMSVPKIGRVKIDRLLRQHKISPSKTIGGMSDRQRNDLVYSLRRR